MFFILKFIKDHFFKQMVKNLILHMIWANLKKNRAANFQKSSFVSNLETFIFIHCSLYFFAFLYWKKFFSNCFRQAFHLGYKKVVALNWWSSYTVMIIQKFAWEKSALVVLDEWQSHRGGHLNMFDTNVSS